LQEPRNQFAIVLDGLVVSAPRSLQAITGGQAQITGDFTQKEAQGLANQLKFGALPISFVEQTEQNISATLGGEQLRRGLLAGLIGLGLVVLYSLLQYRALGLVTIASLSIAGVITYSLVVLLGWRQGYRLSLPGVAGLIVSIGITADSFIVFFERVRDEVRDGRTLLAATEAAWLRARRTILISDGVSLLAAVVLWLLALGGVKGFAFPPTTLVDGSLHPPDGGATARLLFGSASSRPA
jgi:preprotein translocase subunit SecD